MTAPIAAGATPPANAPDLPPGGPARRRLQATLALLALLAGGFPPDAAPAQPPSATPVVAPGGAPAGPPPTVTPVRAVGRRLEAIPDARVRAAVAEVLRDAESRGLPLDPLVAKALEGVEKQAPPVRIEAAVRAMAARLASARSALAPHLSEAELTAGADALAVGIPADVLQRLRTLARRRSTAVPLGVLSQLVSRGVPAPQAASAVGELVTKRANDGQLLALGRAVQDDMASGVSATEALDLRTRALARALPPLLGPPVGAVDVMGPPGPRRKP